MRGNSKHITEGEQVDKKIENLESHICENCPISIDNI